MDVQLNEVSTSRKNVKVKISKEEIQEKYASKVAEVRREAQIQGYRPGRVPQRVIERRFGSSILAELKMHYILEVYTNVIKDNDLNPFRDPSIREEEIVFEKDKDCEFEFDLDVLPSFELPDYKEIEVKQSEVRVSSKDLEKSMNDLRKMRGELVVAEEGSESSEGDFLICDVNITAEKENVWGKENYALEIRDKNEIMGMSLTKKSLLGKKADDEIKQKVTIPEDFRTEEYRGKKGEVKIKVLELKTLQLPEMTDEFAKEMGAEDVKDLEGKLKDQIRAMKEQTQSQKVQEEILTKILEKTEIDVPEVLIEEQLASVEKQAREKMESEKKSEDKIKAHLEKNKDKNLEKVTRQLKESLVIEKVAQIEEIKVADGEVERHIQGIAHQYGRWPNEVRAEYEKFGLIDDLKYQIKTQKVLEFLSSSVTKVTNK